MKTRIYAAPAVKGLKSTMITSLPFSMVYSPLKQHFLFYSDGLTNLYGFPDITHFEVKRVKQFDIK